MHLLQVEDRTINHHGSSITVGEGEKDMVEVLPSINELVARDERKELKARKDFYKKISEENKRQRAREKKLGRCKFVGQKLVPLIIFSFTFAYWYYGLTSMKSS